MFLRDIRIKNFLIHQDTHLSFLPLTVFVGPNGGGKSAIFDAILNFSMLARGSLQQAFGPYPFSYWATVYRGGGVSRVRRIGYEVSMSKEQEDTDFLSYEIDYSQTGTGEETQRFTIHNERLIKQPGGKVIFDRSESDSFPFASKLPLEADRSIFAALRQAQITGQTPSETDEMFAYCTQQVSHFNKFRLDPFVLSQPSRLPDLVDDATDKTAPRLGPRLGYHGEDLSASLYYLSETKSSVIDKIKEKITEIEPFFGDFEFNIIGTDRVGFSVRYTDVRGAVPAVRVSAGTLIYIGLVVLVMSPNRPGVLMVEEPENGLTPQAIASFYRCVRELAYCPEPQNRSQVLISSHSPFVICEAWNGEDRDFIHQVKVVSGKAVIKKVSDIIKEQGIQIGKIDGERKHLSISTAADIMSGRFS